jgi:DNA-binding MarR family transcriptional regulator
MDDDAGMKAPAARGGSGDDTLAPGDNLLACIHVVSNLISRAFFAEVESQWGITLPEWRVVLTLMHQPGASAMEITELWGMDKMAVSRAARRLEHEGYVARTQDAADRRRFTLALTAKGKRLYRQIEPGATARYRAILADLSHAERDTVLNALHRMIERIGALRG